MAPSILVAGETLIDFIPDRSGPLSNVESFTRRAGGAPANVAVALASLDATPWFCTRLATDPFGDFLADTLAEHGIPDRFVTRDHDRRTALAFVTHDPHADRGFTFYRDDTADVHLDTSIVPDGTLDEVEAVAVGGVMLTDDPARTATFDLVDRAHDHGCTVFFDPNSRPELWDDSADPEAVVDRMIERADVVKASLEDFEDTEYPTTDPADLAGTLLDAGPHTIFLTLGRDGSLARATDDAPWGSGEWTHPGYTVDPVDTTGAGDAFTAGVIAALDADEPIPEVLAFANAVAAVTTTAGGAMTALPSREEVAAFREEQ